MKQESFNVRVVRRADGAFHFDDRCFMHRLAERRDCMEWVDASDKDRRRFAEQLTKS